MNRLLDSVVEAIDGKVWRLADLNFKHPLSRFLTIQFETYGVLDYRSDWHDVHQPLANSETSWTEGATGIRFGQWRRGLQDLKKGPNL